MKKLICHIFFVCIAPLILKAQQFPTNFASYSLPDGLIDNTINAIAQDKFGYIWLGTSNGLVRFDGKNFTGFSASVSLSSLQSNEILSIQQADSNHLFVVTRFGLSVVNVNKMTATNLVIPPRKGEQVVRVNKLRSLMQSESGNFFITSWSGFYHYNENKELVFRYDDYSATDDANRGFGVYTIWLDKENILIAGQKDLMLYNVQSRSIKKIAPGNKTYIVFSLIEKYKTQQGCHLVQMAVGEIMILPRKGNAIIYVNEQKKQLSYSPLPIDSVSSLFTWRSDAFSINDSLYILSGKFTGLYFLQLNKQTGLFKLDTNALFKNSKLNTLFIDKNRKYWMGFNNGLKMEKNNIVNLQLNPAAGLYEPENDRPPVLQTAITDKYIYTASANSGGTYRFNKNNLEYKKHIAFQFPPFGNKSIHSAFRWSGDSVLFGTDCGLFLYNEKTEKAAFVKMPDWSPRFNWVANIFIDSKKNAWITVNKSKGCYVWKYGAKTPEWLNLGDNKQYGVTEIFHVTESKDGNIWLAGKGVLRFNYTLQKPDYYNERFTNDLTKGNSVNSITADEQGGIWLGNGQSGLVLLNTANDSITLFTKTDGLSDDKVSSLSYYKGYVWIICKNGIFKIDCRTKKITSVCNIRDVYYKPYLANQLSFDATSTSFYTGAGSSVIRFEPDYKKHKQGLPKLLLVYAKSGNDSIIWFPNKPLKVNWKNRNVTLFVNAINYDDAEYQRYAYRIINGTSSDWISMDEQRRITLTNLMAGNTIIEVKVFSPQKAWPDQIITYEIKVTAPFWRTGWFKLLCLLVILGILYSIYMYRLSQTKELTKIRDNISKDLHDEIGATLSGIAMYSHMVKNNLANNETEAAIASAGIIQHSASEMVTKLNDIIWLIKPHNEALNAIIERLKIYAIEMCAAKNIAAVIRVDEKAMKAKPLLEIRKNLYLFCKEAINNAAKYSKASVLNIEFIVREDELEITIADNGEGFDMLQVKKGNGLDNMQQRAKELNGNLLIKTSSGHGCAICLKIPQQGIVQ